MSPVRANGPSAHCESSPMGGDPVPSGLGGSLTSAIRLSNGHVRNLAIRRVVVVGTATTMVEALAVALDTNPDLEAIGTAATASEVLQLLGRHRPEIAIVVQPKSGLQTLEALGRLQAVAPGVKVVVLADGFDYRLSPHAAAAGVFAHVALDTRLEDLIEVIRTEASCATVVGAPLPPTTTTTSPDPMSGLRPAGLTPRELEVLNLLSEGYRQPAIAARLVISVHTARGHVKNVLRKLGAHSQLEAIAVATRMGLLARSRSAGEVGTAAECPPDAPFARAPGRCHGRGLGWLTRTSFSASSGLSPP